MFWHSLATRRHSIESINARNLFSCSRLFYHIVDFLQLRSHQRRLERRACGRLWLQRRSISILFITLLPLSLLRYLQRTRAAEVERINFAVFNFAFRERIANWKSSRRRLRLHNSSADRIRSSWRIIRRNGMQRAQQRELNVLQVSEFMIICDQCSSYSSTLCLSWLLFLNTLLYILGIIVHIWKPLRLENNIELSYLCFIDF